MLNKLLANKTILHYLRNTIWLVFEKVLGLGVALVVSVWIARHLGPELFGQLSFAQNFSLLFAAFAALGLQRILERDLVDRETDRQAVISTSIFLVVLGATASYSLMTMVMLAQGYDDVMQGLILICGLAAFLQVTVVFLAHFLSRTNAKPYVISNVAAITVSNIVKVLFIVTDAPLYFFALGLVLDGVLLLPILLTITRGTNAQPRLSLISKDLAKTLLANSWPYILTGVLITVYMKIDTVMLKSMLGDFAVGQYSAAAKLSEGLYYLPMIIVASVYPAIVRARKQSEAVYLSRWKNLYSLLFYMALVLAISVSLFSTSIISLLYGAEYAPAAPVLFIHVWASIFVFVSMASGRWLLTENLQRLSIANTFIGVVLNVSLNYYLIPAYGIEGAAYATVISYGASGYFCFILWRRTRPNFYLMTTSVLKLPSLNR